MRLLGLQISLIIAAILYSHAAVAQNNLDISKLPINIVPATIDSNKPLILYITGDGGWNKFSRTLSKNFADKGYPVIALDASKYFWDKKTALQTATDVTKLILTYQQLWKKKKILLIGYSFGADVMPFVFNHLNKEQTAAIVNISLLSPSTHTDFEIHILGLFGADSGGESVSNAINKITAKPITLIFGSEEKGFPEKALTNKNYSIIKLSGGHHYDGDEANVADTILKQLPLE